MNKSETLQAAEVMRRAAEGEIVEMDTGIGWVVAQDIRWDWCCSNYRILDFPYPPQGQNWHNPASLTATRVGVHEGWRLLLEGELSKTPEDAEAWVVAKLWVASLWQGRECNPKFTLRTKSPLPEVKADPMKRPWENIKGIDGFVATRYNDFDRHVKDLAQVVWQACKEHYKIKD